MKLEWIKFLLKDRELYLHVPPSVINALLPERSEHC